MAKSKVKKPKLLTLKQFKKKVMPKKKKVKKTKEMIGIKAHIHKTNCSTFKDIERCDYEHWQSKEPQPAKATQKELLKAFKAGLKNEEKNKTKKS